MSNTEVRAFYLIAVYISYIVCEHAALPPFASTSPLHAECMCWFLLFAGCTAYQYLKTRSDAPTEQQQHRSIFDPSTKLAAGIVCLAVCQKLGGVGWAVPLVTLFVLLLASPEMWIILPPDTNGITDYIQVVLRDRWELLYSALIALFSAATLLSARNSYDIGISLLSAGCQAALYCLVIRQKDHIIGKTDEECGKERSAAVEEEHVSFISFLESVSWRVAITLAVLIAVRPSEPGPLLELGACAIYKAAYWIALLLLILKGHSLATSALATYATSAVAVFRYAGSQRAAAGLIGVAALGQAYMLVGTGSILRKLLGPLFLVFVWGSSYHVTQWPAGAANLSTGVTPLAYEGLARHPIETMVEAAGSNFAKMQDRQSKTFAQAEKEYTRRYKRSPPPGFDTWFNLAVKANATIIDDYDTVTLPFEPFWGLSAKELRARVDMLNESDYFVSRISVENHKVITSPMNDRWIFEMYRDHITAWMEPYLEHLPDFTFALNLMDEPRVAIPNDRLEHLLNHCPNTVVSNETNQRQKFQWYDVSKQNIFDIATLSCSEDSPARSSARFLQPTKRAPFRFIENVTSAKSICDDPYLGGTYGMFTSPSNMRTTPVLVPIFTQNSFTSFQDIIMPSTWYSYRNDEGSYVDEDDPDWDEKKDMLYWVGGSTDGFMTPNNTKQLHRHRFVSLVTDATRPIQLMRKTAAGVWQRYADTMAILSDKIHVWFNSQGDGKNDCEQDACDWERDNYKFGPGEDRAEAYKAKFVFDIDGHSYSERFMLLLGSRSLLFKQTLQREWHDDRLVPWWHYVPVSMGMGELPEMVRYLSEDERGKVLAREIAQRGREWQRTSLRKVDFELAFFRILLEWARLVGDERDGEGAECGEGRVRERE